MHMVGESELGVKGEKRHQLRVIEEVPQLAAVITGQRVDDQAPRVVGDKQVLTTTAAEGLEVARVDRAYEPRGLHGAAERERGEAALQGALSPEGVEG